MSKRVLVVGDVCIDRYHVGELHGLSAEAPIPVLKQSRTVDFPGMAGNVVKILQILDPTLQVDLALLSDANIPIKNRLMTEAGTQLARWDVEDWCIPTPLTSLLPIAMPNAVVVCDYGKGAVDAVAIDAIRHLVEFGVPTFVDTKGDPLVWKACAHYITFFPNAQEFALWRTQYLSLPSVVHKMGKDGLEFLQYGKVQGGYSSVATSVQSVCGAGDTILAATVKALLEGRDWQGALAYAIECAGKVVSARFDERYSCLS